jgi:hypothetical protein
LSINNIVIAIVIGISKPLSYIIHYSTTILLLFGGNELRSRGNR